MNKELLQQALDALNKSLRLVQDRYKVHGRIYGYSHPDVQVLKHDFDVHKAAIAALEAAIAQPVQPAVSDAAPTQWAPAQADQAAQIKDAERYQFIKAEAYEAVIPYGGQLSGSRTAWMTKMHPGNSFEKAINAAMQAKRATQ